MNRLLRSNLKFKHLQLLVALDDVRHISKAAEMLHTSQPAVSKALAEIESMADLRVFDRTSRGVEPTARGLTLIRYAREALAQLDRLSDDLAAFEAGTQGTVHVGAMMTATAMLIPRGVALLKAASPNTTVRIEEGLIEPLIDRLMLGHLDVVICRLDAKTFPDGVEVERLYTDPVVVVAGAGHPLADRDGVGWRDLALSSWVLPPAGTSARERFDVHWSEQGLGALHDLVETASFLSVLSLLRERPTLAILPGVLARSIEAAGLLRTVRVPPVHPGSAIGMVRVRERDESPAVARFREQLRRAAASLEGASR